MTFPELYGIGKASAGKISFDKAGHLYYNSVPIEIGRTF